MKIKERERNLPNLPVKPTWRPKWPAQPTRPPFCRLPPPRPEAARWRVPTPPWPPPACHRGAPDASGYAPQPPLSLPSLSALSRPLPPPLLSLSRSPSRAHRRHSPLPHPEPPPRPLGVPSSSATSPSSSPPSQATSDALHRRHRAVFFTHGRRMPLVDSPPPTPPRDHRAAHRPHCEPPCRTPLFPLAFASSRP